MNPLEAFKWMDVLCSSFSKKEDLFGHGRPLPSSRAWLRMRSWPTRLTTATRCRFFRLKQFRLVATRHEKTARNRLAAIVLRLR